MTIPCFMVELCNKRTVHHDGEGCDEHEDCSRARGWDEKRYDVRRLDNGGIVAADVWGLHGALPVGSMYWLDISTSERPTGPEDYAGYSEHDLEVIRDDFRRFPDGRKVCSFDPTLPQRRPSMLFGSGPHLHVVTPGGPWNIDSRASNCTMPYDYEHRCWVRHGEPPNVTVDKNGKTCAAGAGSIQCGSYHGFLRDGGLT